MTTDHDVLADFARHLQREHFADLVQANLRQLDGLESPFVKAFADPKDLQAAIEAPLGATLAALIEGRGVEAAIARIEAWARGDNHTLSKNADVPDDFALYFLAQKRAFISFLKGFVTDLAHGIALVEAIDDYYLHVQDAASRTVGRLRLEEARAQREVLSAVTEELKAANESLGAQAEELERQHRLLEGILRSLPANFAYLDKDMVFRAVNDNYVAFYGRRHEDFIGQHVGEVLPQAMSQRGDSLRHVLTTGEPVRAIAMSVPRTDADGTTRETVWDRVLSPLFDDEGAVMGVISLSFEVSERVHLAREVAEQRNLLQSIIESAPAGIALLDASFRVQWINPAYTRMSGRRHEEYMDRRIFEDVAPEARVQFEPLLRNVLESREAMRLTDVPYRQILNGQPRDTWWDITYDPMLDEEGTVSGILIFAQEVSERREQDRLQAAYIRQLEEADHYKDEFLSVISHELRTPLNFITGFASILQDEVQGPLNGSQQEAIIKILAGSDHMLGLVENLLDLARIQSGRLQVAPEPTPYASLVEENLGYLRPLADKAGIRLASELHEAGAPLIDGPRIGQVLTNLLGNAIKFSPPQTVVTVRSFVRDGQLVTEVDDEGRGIAPEEIPKLFRRFGQLDSSSTRAANGTGLGLAISKALVEAHEGEIGVRSAGHGHGSTFWFTLPLES